MGARERPSQTLLADLLETSGPRIPFFHLVQMILDDAGPDAPTPGKLGPARSEVVQFRAALSLASASSDVRYVEKTTNRRGDPRYRITQNFMGLYGPASPLPQHFTTRLTDVEPIEEVTRPGIDEGPYPVGRDFLDIFTHRAVSLLWRAWRKYRHDLGHDGMGQDEHSIRLLCLAGLGAPGAMEALDIPRTTILRQLGCFTARPIPAANLMRLLRAQFDVPVHIAEFQARSAQLLDAQTTCLGTAVLGQGTHLGNEFTSVLGAFRVVIGPIPLSRAQDFLPGTHEFQQMVSLVRFAVKDPLEFDILIRVQPEGLKGVEVSTTDPLPLGQLTWLAPQVATEKHIVLSTTTVDPATAR